ncbi:hypothetical protein ACFS07_36125 [Undibacterium arcticum]
MGQHSSYVGSWIKALKEDKKMKFFRASRDAEEITEYVMNYGLEKGGRTGRRSE